MTSTSSSKLLQKGSGKKNPTATQRIATIMESPTDEQDQVDSTVATYRVPKPRPTSIFMTDFQYIFDPNSTDTQKEEQITEAPLVPRSHIESLYKSGAPIWTKEDLRIVEGYVDALVNHLEEFHSFPFRCLDDSIVIVEDVNPHFVIGKPTIAFRMYQDLLYSTARFRDKIAQRGLAICSQGIPSLPNVALTEHQVLQLYLHEKEKWDKSDACSSLKLILATSKIPTNINKMVCFGLGNLESAYLSSMEPTHHRSIVQHATALTIAAAVQRKINKPIKIYAQDPNYSLFTKRTLARQEIHVIDCYGATGFTYVDEDAIVFSVAPNVPVKQVVADIARPPIMIWEKVSTPEEEEEKLKKPRLFNGGYMCPWTLDNDSPRTQDLVKDCKATPFPANDGHFLPNLTIYIRKPST
ncbi:hypothetical protein F4809DRAFT_655930 [Biscogniauxia mediterranea]|nr:hypothetical protein F4809DRAFT_655930 [Biscogniauxia mediterranea]